MRHVLGAVHSIYYCCLFLRALPAAHSNHLCVLCCCGRLSAIFNTAAEFATKFGQKMAEYTGAAHAAAASRDMAADAAARAAAVKATKQLEGSTVGEVYAEYERPGEREKKAALERMSSEIAVGVHAPLTMCRSAEEWEGWQG